MKKIRRNLFLFIYYIIASKLPNYAFPGGKLYNWFRIYCLKRVIHIGKDCRIMRNVYVGSGENISIGDYCRVNENVRLDNVQIGNHVMIARDSVFLGKSHEASDLSIPMEQQGNIKSKSTIVENDVWFGIRSVILPGLKISKGSIIGAGGVLTKSTKEYGVYVGVPAKLLKERK
jgi:maltose O-acetyltransferase